MTILNFEGENVFENVRMFDIYRYPFFIGIAMLNFEGNPTSLNVRASMKHPHNFSLTFLIAAIIVSALSILVASTSYIAYKDQIQDLVTLNLPNNSFTVAIRLVYCL